MNNKYSVIGLMSGTSLDGLDIVACSFKENNNKWEYKICFAETVQYAKNWIERFSLPYTVNSEELMHLHQDYGVYLGQLVKAFLQKTKFEPDLICSHGHTILHQPEKGITFQVGLGSKIAEECKKTVVSDYRSLDVELGGQGAPLVPIGDRCLFSEFGACLNLGGFANISFERNGDRIAYDICPVNIIMNRIANNLGQSYDKDGGFASNGAIDEELLKKLDELEYYKRQTPKSLGREWLEKEVIPLIDSFDINSHDLLRTLCEHCARQIVFSVKSIGGVVNNKVLVTGGGAFNDFLMSRLNRLMPNYFIVPEEITVNYKEALVFGFLGVLKYRGEINCLSSVTGASKDSSTGIVYLVE